MKFRVIGANRDTGARMTLEFEAESKAAAERKASQTGMSVNRVENITDGSVGHASEPRATRRRSGSFGLLVRMIVLLAIVLAAVWWFYLRPRGFHVPGL